MSSRQPKQNSVKVSINKLYFCASKRKVLMSNQIWEHSYKICRNFPNFLYRLFTNNILSKILFEEHCYVLLPCLLEFTSGFHLSPFIILFLIWKFFQSIRRLGSLRYPLQSGLFLWRASKGRIYCGSWGTGIRLQTASISRLVNMI